LAAKENNDIVIYSTTNISTATWTADTTTLINSDYYLPTVSSNTSYKIPLGNLVYFDGEWCLLISTQETSTGYYDQHMALLKTLSLSNNIDWEVDSYFTKDILSTYSHQGYYNYGQMFIHNNELYIFGCNTKRYVKIDASGKKTLVIRSEKTTSEQTYGATIDNKNQILSLEASISMNHAEQMLVTNAPEYFQIPYGEENQFIKYKK
jgi:hypothetical protein